MEELITEVSKLRVHDKAKLVSILISQINDSFYNLENYKKRSKEYLQGIFCNEKHHELKPLVKKQIQSIIDMADSIKEN